MSSSPLGAEKQSTEPQVLQVHGRTVLAKQDYSLPTDQEERGRLDIQHEALRRFVGGLYFAPELVKTALTSPSGTVARILDVGTGSGAWAIDMAKERPDCEVIGVDLSPPTSRSDYPQNLRFQVFDVNNPLEMESASVNFIHGRAVDHGISHYPKWLHEVTRILRSSGIYLIFKGHFALVRDGGEELPTVPIGEEGYTGLQNLFSAMYKLVQACWDGLNPYLLCRTWIEENSNFENIDETEILLPIGAWQSGLDENARIAAELMKENFLKIVHSFKPALMTAGYEEAVINQWVTDAVLEISELRVKFFVKWSAIWGTRSSNQWTPYHSCTSTQRDCLSI